MANLKKADDKTDSFLTKLVASPRTVIYTVIAVSLILALGFCTGNALAGGYEQPKGGPDSAAFAEAHAVGGPTQQNVGISAETNMKAYAGGSTGLTSTAPCLGSGGIFFNAFSSTYVEKGCVLRHYAATQCKDDACRSKLACLDPDLIPEAKAVLGCKP